MLSLLLLLPLPAPEVITADWLEYKFVVCFSYICLYKYMYIVIL